MSNGLYSNNSGLPTMTRSEYIAEYHDITTYFDEEKARIKKTFPFFLILAIVNIVFLIGSGIGLFPSLWSLYLISSSFGEEAAKWVIALPYLLCFPLCSLIIRKVQIRKKEKQRLDELEHRKKICIDIGTYDAEK